MNALLKLEFHKLKRQKWFYISLGLMVAMLVITAVAQKLLPGAISGMIPDDPAEQEAMGLTPEQVTEMKEAIGLPEERGGFVLGAVSASLYTLLSAVFIAIVVCEDYEQQTVKNIFSRGYSRRSVFISKAVCVFTACTVMFIAIHLAAALLAVLLLGMKTFNTGILKNLAVLYLVCMAFNAMHLAVSSIIRKAGGSIAICIVAPTLLSTLIGVLQSLVKLEKPDISSYWIESFLGAAGSLETASGRLVEVAIASCVYIVLFIFLGDLLGRKVEA